MKKLIITSILAALVTIGTTVMAQDYPDEYLGLPGDNLNLYAVMKLFQESQTLEVFERNLNDENTRINNLDLNGDGLVDYINVIDYVDGDVHTIVLRAELGHNETQDVAVFTVQRFSDGSVQIQLVGDDQLYGKNYIIEPNYGDNYGETPNPGYTGRPANRVNVTVIRTTPFEVAAWPLVRFIYAPNYVVWHSSWYWGYYPSYWHPWRPFFWDFYYGYHYNLYNDYYAHYRHWQHYRYSRYNDFYYSGIRSHSPQVAVRIRDGQYRSTYSHPEQRREGEALYTSVHSDRNSNTGRTGNTSVSGQRRSTGSQSNRGQAASRSRSNTTQQSTGAATGNSGNNRNRDQKSNSAGRSSTFNSNRPVTKPSNGQNAESPRRQGTFNDNRPVTKPSSGQNADAPKRQTTNATNQTDARSSSDQNRPVSRRPSTTTSQKPSPRSQPAQRGENARTSGSSKNAASSATRKSTESKSSSKKDNKTKNSDNNNNSRRK